MTPNLPLLRKVLSQIDAEPDSWVQRAWGLQWRSLTGMVVCQVLSVEDVVKSCDTAFCIAGHVALLEGWAPPEWEDGEAAEDWISVDGHLDSVSDVARRALGLTHCEAEMLFDSDNSRADVDRIAAGIAARAGERL